MRGDVCIVGGGLAGAALAARLGSRATLIEREAGPHDKVCGEFLSREAVLHLRALAVDPLALGGHPIGRVRLATGRAQAEVALPFEGVGLSRRVLDEALLRRAVASGARVQRGQAVTALLATGPVQMLRLQDGRALRAAQTVLATGKHDVRGWRRGRGRQNDLVGFKLHLRPAPAQRAALDGVVELMLFRGGYAGLQRIEDGQATLCLLIRRQRLVELGGRWSAVLAAACEDAPLLARRLAEVEILHRRPLSIAGIPYGYVAPVDSAVWRLGDQSAVIPSFTGDGMSIALHSAALAATLLDRGARPDALQVAMRRDVGMRVVAATMLSLCSVRRPLQPLAVLAARLLPALVAELAAATRVPDRALQAALAAYGERPGLCPGPAGAAGPKPLS